MSGAVEVWFVPLSGAVPVDLVRRVLPAYARGRPGRTRRQRERLEANAALTLLGGPAPAAGGAPRGDGWTCEPAGRPVSPAGWSVSLSHAEGLAAVAVAASGIRVGVDVERRAGLRDLAGMARTTLADDELRRWSAEPRGAQHAAFLAHWVRKEAVLKALGTGLGGDLRSVRSGADGAIVALPPTAGPVADWTLRDLPVEGASAAAAVAVDRPAVEIRRRHAELTALLGAAGV